jgi:hypothetical protein
MFSKEKKNQKPQPPRIILSGNLLIKYIKAHKINHLREIEGSRHLE